MNEPEETWLVSELVTAIPAGMEWPGSVVRWCSICASAIWLSREAVKKLETEPGMKPMCAACATPMMQDTAHARDGKLRVFKVDPKGLDLPPVLEYLKERYGK